MKRIKLALVGCGRIVGKHLKAIEDNAHDYELVAVCDIDEEAAAFVADKYSVPYYKDMEEMLKQLPNINVVSVCTPSGLHARQAILAAEYGKHIITEKPMACRLDDGKLMIDATKKMNVHLFVVKQNRLNPTVQAMKKAIDDGDFGKIHLVHINVFWTRPQSYYDQASWRGTWEMDGGAFMNQAAHYVDLLEWLVGPIDSIQAITKTLARKIEAEDTGVINVQWNSGALGSMAVTMLTYPKNLEGSITILGEKGTIRLDGVALNEIKHWCFSKHSEDDVLSLNYMPDSVYGNGHGLYYQNVADVLLKNRESISDGQSGLRTLEILSAIYCAAKSGEKIYMTDMRRDKK